MNVVIPEKKQVSFHQHYFHITATSVKQLLSILLSPRWRCQEVPLWYKRTIHKIGIYFADREDLLKYMCK